MFQIGSPSCPAQLAQVLAAPHLAMVETLAEGQASSQRHPHRGWNRGAYAHLLKFYRTFWPITYSSAYTEWFKCTQIDSTAPTWRLRDTTAPAASISGFRPTPAITHFFLTQCIACGGDYTFAGKLQRDLVTEWSAARTYPSLTLERTRNIAFLI